jgi:glyoxylase-like metal-dependent hydrolase (beta-lactamase superfamily II)
MFSNNCPSIWDQTEGGKMFGNKSVTQVASNIYYLDSRKVDGFGVSGVYFVVADGITLIETGTARIAPDILKAVCDIGFKETDIKNAIVTHIHLDHAGGTGWLVNRLPHLKVYVHENGSKHLHDPSKLIESAKMVYGDLKTIYEIHGEIWPVPVKNLIPVKDLDLNIGGGLVLKIFNAPGHSSHHLCIFEPHTGCLFSGEALGHYHPETDMLQPAVAPPAFDFEKNLQTMNVIEGMNPELICFSQFGCRSDAIFVIDEARCQLKSYYDSILAGFKRNLSSREIVQDMLPVIGSGKNGPDPLSQSMLVSIVVGYEVYFKRRGLL